MPPTASPPNTAGGYNPGLQQPPPMTNGGDDTSNQQPPVQQPIAPNPYAMQAPQPTMSSAPPSNGTPTTAGAPMQQPTTDAGYGGAAPQQATSPTMENPPVAAPQPEQQAAPQGC